MKVLFLNINNINSVKNIKINYIIPNIKLLKNKLGNFGYGSIIESENKYYIYINKGKLFSQYIEKYEINNNDFILEKKFFLKHASHNFYVFKNKNKKIFGIGGQSLISFEKKNFYNDNMNYNILKKDSDIATWIFQKKKKPIKKKAIFFSDPNIPNKSYYNGLHLFKFNSNKKIFENINNNIPIINGFHKGRNEGYYSLINENKERGYLVFDTISNIIYNKNSNKYYLFQRCNFDKGYRRIQISSSENLKNWEEFKLININEILHKNTKDITLNYYCPNFFCLEDCNLYFGILKRTKFNKKKKKYFDNNLALYYSENLIDWNFMININIINKKKKDLTHSCLPICGKPIKRNEKHIFLLKICDEYIQEINWNSYKYSYIINENLNELGIFTYEIKNNYEDFYISMELQENNLIELIDTDNNIKLTIDDFKYLEEKNIYKLINKEKKKNFLEKKKIIKFKFKNIKIYYLEFT